MTEKQLNELALEAARALADEWQIGRISRFCDDPPDWDAAEEQEIASKLKPFLIRAATSPNVPDQRPRATDARPETAT
jgi:hypothetical protein